MLFILSPFLRAYSTNFPPSVAFFHSQNLIFASKVFHKLHRLFHKASRFSCQIKVFLVENSVNNGNFVFKSLVYPQFVDKMCKRQYVLHREHSHRILQLSVYFFNRLHLIRCTGIERRIGKQARSVAEISGCRDHGTVVTAQGKRRRYEFNAASAAGLSQGRPQV